MQYSGEKLKLKHENSQIWMFSPNKLGSGRRIFDPGNRVESGKFAYDPERAWL